MRSWTAARDANEGTGGEVYDTCKHQPVVARQAHQPAAVLPPWSVPWRGPCRAVRPAYWHYPTEVVPIETPSACLNVSLNTIDPSSHLGLGRRTHQGSSSLAAALRIYIGRAAAVVTVLSAVSLMSSLIAYRDAVFQMNSRIPDCPPHRANVRKMRVVSGEFK